MAFQVFHPNNRGADDCEISVYTGGEIYFAAALLRKLGFDGGVRLQILIDKERELIGFVKSEGSTGYILRAVRSRFLLRGNGALKRLNWKGARFYPAPILNFPDCPLAFIVCTTPPEPNNGTTPKPPVKKEPETTRGVVCWVDELGLTNERFQSLCFKIFAGAKEAEVLDEIGVTLRTYSKVYHRLNADCVLLTAKALQPDEKRRLFESLLEKWEREAKTA